MRLCVCVRVRFWLMQRSMPFCRLNRNPAQHTSFLRCVLRGPYLFWLSPRHHSASPRQQDKRQTVPDFPGVIMVVEKRDQDMTHCSLEHGLKLWKSDAFALTFMRFAGQPAQICHAKTDARRHKFGKLILLLKFIPKKGAMTSRRHSDLTSFTARHLVVFVEMGFSVARWAFDGGRFWLQI